MSNPPAQNCDIIIVGGGLAGGLAALALRTRRPELDVRLIESAAIGGNHIWSFFDSDVAASDRWLIEPLIQYRWDSYDVAFPAHRRTLASGYNSFTGEALAAAVAMAMPAANICCVAAVEVGGKHVVLANRARIGARHVIDARGGGDTAALDCGWQKFVGQALRVEGGHGLVRPIVMDAMVDQLGGYRFVYCLPLDVETVFVEDTYYTDTPDLDIAAVRGRIGDYAAVRGWREPSASREEVGVLPVVVAGTFDRFWPAADGVARLGVRSGAFHATTGYSLPDAVRMAAGLPDLADRDDLPALLRTQAAATWRRQRFYRMLDAMLFRAAAPEQRYRILERFYRLSPPLIARFYAGCSTRADKLRILAGKPPIPVRKAIAAVKDFDWL